MFPNAALQLIAQDGPELVVVSLEFDESRSKTRLRAGILDVEAVYPILETWLNRA